MEPNKEPKKKDKYSDLRKGLFAYTMLFQMIFTVIGLAFLGDWIGTKYFPETDDNLIFTAAGVVLGFIVAITTFVNYLKREEIYEKHHRD